MGSVFSRIWKAISGIRESRVNTGVGKTTMLYYLRLGEKVRTIPTIGFNVETVRIGKIDAVCWDIGGEDKIRPLWRHYMTNMGAVVFVVDSNDRARLSEAMTSLECLVASEEYIAQPILIVLNKQDLPNALTVTEFVDLARPGELFPEDTEWHVQPTIATEGEGLSEGFEWLATQL